jgi:rubrerythrin
MFYAMLAFKYIEHSVNISLEEFEREETPKEKIKKRYCPYCGVVTNNEDLEICPYCEASFN